MLRKFFGTVKIVRSVRDSRSELKKKGFSTFYFLTKVLNIGMLKIINNLKLDLLEITDFECNFYM